MDVKLVQAGIFAVAGELNLEFQFVLRDRQTTDGAFGSNAGAAPRPVGSAARQFSRLNYSAGFVAEVSSSTAAYTLCVYFICKQPSQRAIPSVIFIRCPMRASAERTVSGDTWAFRAMQTEQRAAPRITSVTASASVAITATVRTVDTRPVVDLRRTRARWYPP
jgi:hypothetical protein